MRIYFLKFPLVPTLGGAEFHTLKLAQHFQAQGHEIKLITSDQCLFRLFEKHRLSQRRMFIGWEPTSKWSLLLWPLTWLLARRKLKKIMQTAPADSIFFCQSLTEKLILTNGRIIWLEHKVPGRWLKQNPLRFLYLKYAKRVKIITVSNFAKQELIKLGVLENNIEVVYPSVSVIATPNLSRGKQSQFTIGILGRLDPEKGILQLLHTLIPYLPNHPDWRILIAGDGLQKNEIKVLARKYSQIRVLGFMHNLDDFFSQISVLVYPSLTPESFGLSILESLSRGIPVIASSVGAIPEINSVLLVSQPEDWIKHLEFIQTPSNYTAMSQAALASAQNFSKEKMFAVFDRLLQNR